jgi:hypothetical protein
MQRGIRQRDLVDGLMNLHARMIEQTKANHEEWKRLTEIALHQEQMIRKNGAHANDR